MGKRELLLIVGFVVLGVVIYQATAPPSGPDDSGGGIGGFIDKVRREISEDRSSAEVTSTTVHAVPDEVVELRLELSSAKTTIVGEERDDIESTLLVRSTGYDEEDARKFATRTVLVLDQAGSDLDGHIQYPDEATQHATLTLRIPERLRVVVDSHRGGLQIDNVSAVELNDARGETIVRQVEGRVTGRHRGGNLVIEDAGSLRMTIRGSDVRLRRVGGELILETEGGEVDASELAGPLEIDSRNGDLRFEKLEETRGPLRIDVQGGSLEMDGLATEASIDARDTRVDVAMAAAASVRISSEGDDPIELTPPEVGYRLDASTSGGSLTLADTSLPITSTEDEQRASGDVRGGGPTITIRATHGDIRLRSRKSAAQE